ncbi:heat stress transcription factor [Striga asiatica]|uniref:Heat stress transcription factor n=1 Tax=Striga asiatica TaxID=4170 RepID=A0A5A7PBA7_STRAF|nr:heat stress transcription factor [Striga asiatica]
MPDRWEFSNECFRRGHRASVRRDDRSVFSSSNSPTTGRELGGGTAEMLGEKTKGTCSHPNSQKLNRYGENLLQYGMTSDMEASRMPAAIVQSGSLAYQEACCNRANGNYVCCFW